VSSPPPQHARWLAFVTLALAASVACSSPRERLGERPNVLLISIDSLRADHLGIYGNPLPTSPVIDRLAREGVLFEHALAPSSWTLPSHATMLTGKSQRDHQTTTTDSSIAREHELVSEAFARAGYETVGFFSGPFLHPVYGFSRGFEHYVSCQAEDTARAEGGADAWRTAHNDRTNHLVRAAFQRWVGERSNRPFFAFVHMWDVHFDYVPPEPFDSMFDPDYTGPLDGHNIGREGFPLDAPPRDVEHLKALYDGEIRYTDQTIGELLDALRRAGQLDRTLIVVTSDHGEEFLEHGNKTHRKALYEESIHVPLIAWANSGLPRGARIREPVSLEDVAPTILDLAGLPPLRAADGRSLRASIEGREPSDAGRTVFSELYDPGSGDLKIAAARRGERKLLLQRPKRWASYDLVADPGESHPVPGRKDHALTQQLDGYVTESIAAVSRRAKPTAEAPQEVRDRLRSLGYIK
jgi:arylsulfatase A-like enzyme